MSFFLPFSKLQWDYLAKKWASLKISPENNPWIYDMIIMIMELYRKKIQLLKLP